MNVTVARKSYYLDTYNGCLSIFHHPMHTMRQVKQRNKQYKPRGPQQWSAFYSTNPANDVADLANDNIEWQLTLNPKYQNNTEHNELDEAKSYQHNDFKGKTRFAAGRRE